MKKTFKFTEKERFLIFHLIENEQDEGTFTLIDRIEQIVSERITPEQDTIKPYHEHGNSVASDRTESGESVQSAEDVLFKVWKEWAIDLFGDVREFTFDEFQSDTTWAYFTKAMTTYASQVCADKEADLQDMTALRESAMRTVKNLADRIEPLQNELDRLNESLTVMVRRNAELEAQIDQFTNPLRIG